MLTVTDIVELIEYHLIACAPDDERAENDLARLMSEIQALSACSYRFHTSWAFCDRCGCSVDRDLIQPDGHHYAHDGDFCCADCSEGDAAHLEEDR